jgi:hypothetical protein
MAVVMTSPERRNASRITVARIAYVNFEENNGGIILNISEAGICFHSAAPLISEEGTIHFWISDGGSSKLEGVAQVIWTDVSRRRGGLRFVNMSGQAREKLFDAISEPGLDVAIDHTSRQCGWFRGSLIRLWVPGLRFFHGFAGGLAVGCLVSVLIAGAFMFHRKMGSFFIRTGELLGANTESQNGHVTESRVEKTFPLQPYLRDAHQQSTSIETTRRHNARDDMLVIVPAVPIKVKREPVQSFAQSKVVMALPSPHEAHAGNPASNLPPPLTTPSATGSRCCVVDYAYERSGSRAPQTSTAANG